MKRSYSEQSDFAEEASSSSMFHLKSQNRALSLEMLRYKRQLSEARKELDMIRGKSREMESLVSIIQRAWSQLDIDASMLLDGFGDSEHLAEAGGNSELLYRLIHAGSDYHSLDPTDVSSLPNLQIDEWSSAEELSEAAVAAKKALILRKGEGSSSESKVNNSSIDVEFGGKVDETLCGHASFTLSLLERLCFVLSDSGILDHLPDSLGAIADAKALHAEIFALKDRVTKLSSEIIDMTVKLHVSEKLRSSAEKVMDKSVTEFARQSANGVVSSTASGAPMSPIEGDHTLALGDDAYAVKEMRLKISALEKQLAESEGAKAKAEMTLTERLARPLSQTEAQVADMRRAMEDLRHQGRQRVVSLISEGAVLQERVLDLEAAMIALEAGSEQRCAEATAAATAEIESVNAEKRAIQSSLYAAQADISTSNQLKLQVGELTILESSARSECLKLQLQIASIAAAQEVLHSHLANSRSREVGYETRLSVLESVKIPNGHVSSSSSSSSSSGSSSSSSRIVDSSAHDSLQHTKSDERNKAAAADNVNNNNAEVSASSSGDTSGHLSPSQAGSSSAVKEPHALTDTPSDNPLPTVLQVQERAKETQIELDEARASLNDLILEIESVSVEEARSREQSARILRQMADSQAVQRGVLEENLRLQDQIVELKATHQDVESRIEVVEAVMKQQDSIISQLRCAELAARTDIRNMKRTGAEESSSKHQNEQLLLEAEQNLKLADHSVDTAKKRNIELQNRCDELSAQWEAERKLRMEAQREPKAVAVKKEKNGGTGAIEHLNHEDAAMLELTLGMLRCSVCRDRFKEVALTRCFHLFCKECIDENLRNRHRKCPACGEKFGQDDVKSIFFTD